MKTKDQKSTSEGIYYERVDELIDKKFPKLLERAQIDGSHQGMDNNPAVDATSIEPNISVYKAACEAIIAEIMQFIMPASSNQEAKMEADHYKEKDKVLDDEIKQKEEEKRQAKYKLGNSDVHGIAIKLIVVGVATLILSTGDMFYNTMSFLMTGDNTFFALVLAGVFSFAVFLFSHVATFFYKSRKTAIQRRMVLIGTFLLVTALFYGLGIYRSMYLENHDVHVSPFTFVIFNLFLFIVSALLSFFILPTWKEIGENMSRMKLLAEIAKCTKDVENLKKNKEEIKKILYEKSQGRIRNIDYAKRTVNRVNKHYHEMVSHYINANINARKDGKIPKCFTRKIPDLNISDYEFIIHSPVNTKSK